MSRASVETYRRIETEGVLSERRWQVYTALWLHENERPGIGLTHNEVSHYVTEIHEFPEGYRNNTVARLCELEKQLVVRRTGDMECPRSHDLCTTWMTVDRMPIDAERNERKHFWLLLYPEDLRRKGYAFRVKANAERAQKEKYPDTALMEVEETLPRTRLGRKLRRTVAREEKVNGNERH